jgi:hypothetical protein
MIKAKKGHAAFIDLSYHCCKVLSNEEDSLIINLRRWL